MLGALLGNVEGKHVHKPHKAVHNMCTSPINDRPKIKSRLGRTHAAFLVMRNPEGLDATLVRQFRRTQTL